MQGPPAVHGHVRMGSLTSKKMPMTMRGGDAGNPHAHWLVPPWRFHLLLPSQGCLHGSSTDHPQHVAQVWAQREEQDAECAHEAYCKARCRQEESAAG